MERSVRQVFIESADAALELVGHRVVMEMWDDPSALDGYRIGGLAAHLCRAVSTPLGYLDGDAPEADARLLSAPEYFRAALGDHDPVDSRAHTAVRQRSDDMAASGPMAVIDATRDALQTLRLRLEVEPDERSVAVFGGAPMNLDEYLKTRIVEMVIHGDDLAVSCPGIEGIFSESAWSLAAGVVARLAESRMGDRALVLGLSRHERSDRPQAF